ncbi:hypothetical protein SAY86_006817 [Trapa natans]|uniref:Uncharacterized protein n=1 Tax=Trapa natans TaxID=22666 RepID=A0AAN7L7B9_TRANT|nr:hypothetical protein SAY86_006817 [Trapa natans]
MVHEPSEKGGPPTPRRPGLPVSSFLAVLSKKASHVSKKLRPHNNDKADLNHGDDGYDDTPGAETVKPQRSTMRTPITHRPKELLTTVSNKAIRLIHSRKRGDAGAEPEENLDEEEDFGDGGV